MKILILGGYGVFGGRLAALLSDISEFELLICGRNLRKAEAFCASYRGRAKVQPRALDRLDIARALALEQPELVVDASGPFQDYGSDRYSVIEACLAAHVDYLDFADAADFVFGVSQFDAEAKIARTFVLSGVSSFPVLTAAVLRAMANDMDIVSVEGGIAPSPYAGIGLNVMRAVVGYAGAPVTLVRGGRSAEAIGLAESMRYTIAVPGRLPLRNIHFSLVDVPDLQVIPPEHPSMTDIWMGAGPLPEVLHRILNLLAKARALFHLPSMEPLSPLFYTVLNLMKFGEHRGGMFVRARGTRNGVPVERSWHLHAEGDDGPYIPSMAIEAVIRKLLKGERPSNGARPGTDALELADYEALFRNRSIYMGFRGGEADLPLYPRLLGSAYADLPPRVQQLHGIAARRAWTGQASVRRGRGLLSRCIGAFLGFPREAEQVSVTVTFEPEGDAERWTRNFGGKRFSSLQYSGSGRNDRLLVERFGLVTVALALVVEGGRLLLVPRRWSFLGLSMPKFLLPDGTSFEQEERGKFRFDVEVKMPLVGPIASYRGWLQPEMDELDSKEHATETDEGSRERACRNKESITTHLSAAKVAVCQQLDAKLPVTAATLSCARATRLP